MSSTPELISVRHRRQNRRLSHHCLGEDKNGAKQATATTDKLIGIPLACRKDPGEHVDVVRSGLYPLMYGADIKRGDH